MMHHGLAIGADLEIGLDAVAAGDGCGECRRGILDHARGGIVQAAMGNGSRGAAVEAWHEPHATSNKPSTSMAASAGRAETPTVVRAWRPLSPNTSTIRSDAPFITFGPSVKPGAELMKPPSRTTRVTLSRSPSAPLTCARRLTAQARAAL